MPGTALSDQYGSATIAEALAVIAEQEPSIEVLGITDYLTTENFRETRNAWLEGPETSIKDLFVNVELRLWIKTQRDVAVNMHLLCAADHVDDLDRFLSGLEFHSLQDRFRAERKDLVRLGRAHRTSRTYQRQQPSERASTSSKSTSKTSENVTRPPIGLVSIYLLPYRVVRATVQRASETKADPSPFCVRNWSASLTLFSVVTRSSRSSG